jgi:trimeric autotransporter adhesin
MKRGYFYVNNAHFSIYTEGSFSLSQNSFFIKKLTMTNRNYYIYSIAFSLCIAFSANAQVSVVKDIVVGTKGACQDTFSMMTVGTKTFFTANNGVTGNELWVTDGTDAGTRLVKDIYAGALSSNPQYFMQLNGLLVFFARTAANGVELWKSDGTDAGTVLVKDINAGAPSSYYETAADNPTIVFNNQLFFTADNGAGFNNMELWKTDGTAAGTVLVKDIFSVGGSFPSLFTAYNGKFYFVESRGSLWQSDGTTAGTVLAKTFSSVIAMAVLRNELILAADDNTGKGIELWKTNGSVYVFLKDVDTRPNFSGLQPTLNTRETRFIVYGDYMYFPATDAINGDELWRTDGTTSGTALFKEVRAGASGYPPQNFRIVKNQLFYKCEDANQKLTLFKSDGTVAGTKPVLALSGDDIRFSLPTYFHVHKDILYMNPSPFFGKQLWRTDGTDAGTIKLASSNTDYGLQPGDFASLGDKLLFRGETVDKGFELMSYLPTTAVGDVPSNNNIVQISPNPVQNEAILVIDSPKNGGQKTDFEVSNLQGQTLKSGKFVGNRYNLNCADLSNGMYLLKVQTADGQSIKKLIVQR